MAGQHIRVLLVEDNPGDARLIHWMLRETGEVRFDLAGAETLAAALGLLAEEDFSVVLLDGASVPAGAAGGDYLDYLVPCPGRVGVVIGDVMGHGPGPALLMASTRAYLRAFAEGQEDLGRALARTNRALASDVGEGQFVTLLFALFDRGRGLLRYTSAGHLPGYVLGRDGAVRAGLYSTGL